jgi:L-alanine-DL-glutamate epimerase-like enolase superfamily enzyme
MAMPSGPGLGVALDEEQLARFSRGDWRMSGDR